MQIETKTIYRTDDGKIFDDEGEALEHEKDIRKKTEQLNRLALYIVYHDYSLSKGGRYSSITYLLSDAREAFVLQWCIDEFGEPIPRDIGTRPEAWRLERRGNRYNLEEIRSIAKGGYTQTNGGQRLIASLFVISSDSFEFADLPRSTWRWTEVADK
jgi:hypothetical protein